MKNSLAGFARLSDFRKSLLFNVLLLYHSSLTMIISYRSVSYTHLTNVDKPKPFMPSERTKTSSYVTPPETKEKEGGELLYSCLL